MNHTDDPFPADHARDERDVFIYDQRCWLCRHITAQPAAPARPPEGEAEERLLAEGYREFAEESLVLAESTLEVGVEALPPDEPEGEAEER